MRAITKEICLNFLAGQKKTIGNSHTDGESLFLHGNRIACKKSEKREIEISLCNWLTRTTKERLNGLLELFNQDRTGKTPFKIISIKKKPFLWNWKTNEKRPFPLNQFVTFPLIPFVEVKSLADLKHNVELTGSYFFTRESMKFFGDRMSNYGMRKNVGITDYQGNQVSCFEVYRKKPVKHGLWESAYFSSVNFERVHPKK